MISTDNSEQALPLRAIRWSFRNFRGILFLLYLCAPQEGHAVDPTLLAKQSYSSRGVIDESLHSQVPITSLPIGTITTVAGNGVFDSTGDGGLAIAATVRTVVDLEFDSSGDLYLADAYGQCIRMIKGSTGIISTVAGTGIEGYSGDGSLATAAMLNMPNGVTVDSLSGNLYITDYANYRMRMVTKSTGIITTVAGNGKSGEVSGEDEVRLATEQSIGGPITAAIDSILQHLYIIVSDLVLMVDLKTGYLTIFAGSDQGYSGDGGLAVSATFGKPRGVAVDVTSGNVYIVDSGNSRIRMVTKSTGIVTNVAGGDYVMFVDSPERIDIDAQGNLYITEPNNDRIIKVTKSTGKISYVAGTGVEGFSGDGGPAVAAQLQNPMAIAVNSLSGVVVFSDYNNYRLRSFTVPIPKVSTVGRTVPTVINALAGTGKAGYNGAIDATTAEMYFPSGVALDANTGNVYVADTSNNRIQMIKGKNTISLTAGTGVAGYSGDGGLATAATLNGPNGLAVDVESNVYVADTFNHRIRKIMTVTGIITTVAGTGTYGYSGDRGLATSSMLNNPLGVAIDPNNGNIYIADTFNHRIRMITRPGITGLVGIITTVAGGDGPGYSGDGFIAVFAQISYPARLATDVSGNLYIADQNNNRVRRIEMGTGAISTVAGTGLAGYTGDGGPATMCRLFKPSDVAVDKIGNVYIADSFNNRIRMVDASTGNITTVAGNGAAGYSGDQGLATAAELFRSIAIDVDVYSVLYIADTYNNRVRTVSAPATMAPTVAPTSRPNSGPSSSTSSGSRKSSPSISISINTLIYIVVGVAAFGVILSAVLYCFYCGHSLSSMNMCNWRGSSDDATRQQNSNLPAHTDTEGSQVPSESVNPMTDMQVTHPANSTQSL